MYIKGVQELGQNAKWGANLDQKDKNGESGEPDQTGSDRTGLDRTGCGLERNVRDSG